MENDKKLFNIDHWYGVTLFIGVLCLVAPFFFSNTTIVNPKHIIGLGIGLLTLSIAYIKANRYMQRFDGGNLLQWREIIHDPFTIILALIGTLLTALFLSLIVYSLIYT